MKRVVAVLVALGLVLAVRPPGFAERQPTSEYAVPSALLAVSASSGSPVMGGQICIQADRLEPPLLFVEPEGRVDFINQSGRLIRMVFENRDSDEHTHYYSVWAPDAISAVFLQPGTHRYTVHFLDPGMRDLEGTVVVGEHGYEGLEVCDYIHGGCLER